MLECDVPSLDVTGLAQPLHECLPIGRWGRWGIGRSRDRQVPDAEACCLLRTCHERQRHRRAKCEYELSPSNIECHVTLSGKVMPSNSKINTRLSGGLRLLKLGVQQITLKFADLLNAS
jgi:hypothetical protein